jgi:hypothetical protein
MAEIATGERLPAVASAVWVRAVRALAPLGCLAAAAWLWALSLPNIDPDRMNDYGLVSVLPWSFPAALVLLSLSFALTLASGVEFGRYFRALLVLEIACLALVLYGTTAFVEVVPRSATMWLHLGVADYIAVHGTVDRTIDAYFNWPGFFIGLAFLQRVAGLDSLAGVGAWAPLFFNVLDALVVWILVRVAGRSERVAWLAAWLFLCTNWIGQDVLSPQAFGYFMYLNILVLAILSAVPARRWLLPQLRALRLRPTARVLEHLALATTDGSAANPAAAEDARVRERAALSGSQRAFATLLVFVLFGAVAISHQLSPYAIAIVVGALVVVNVTSLRAMPLLMALVILVWFTYSAVPFFQQFVADQSRAVGEVRQNISASVVSRIGGPQEHELIVYLRLVMTGLLWGLAILSAVIRLRRGHRDTVFYVIGLAPFLLIGLQSYGGEIALRIFLFTLPAAVFFIAAALLSEFEARRDLSLGLAVLALSLVFLPLFVFTRYGNERLDYFRRGEYQTVKALYRIAPPGSEFFVVAPNLPWRWQRYADDRTVNLYQYLGFYSNRLYETPATIANTMASKTSPTFLILTPGQRTFATFVGGLTPTTVTRFERLIARSPRFRPVYSNGPSVIYKVAQRSRA